MEKVTAKDVLNELSATSTLASIGSVDDVSAGDVVVYNQGHEHAGMIASIVGVHKELGTVDLKVGQATRVDVAISDISKMMRKH